jgi:hypothetical protein
MFLLALLSNLSFFDDLDKHGVPEISSSSVIESGKKNENEDCDG